MAGTYLLVKVYHVPMGFTTINIVGGRRRPAYLSNLANVSAPIVCRCSSTVGIGPLRLYPRLLLQAFLRDHLRTSRSSWKLGSKADSSPSVNSWTGTEIGWGLPLGKASSSFVNSFKASNRLRSVCFRFAAPRLLALRRGVLVPDSKREGGEST